MISPLLKNIFIVNDYYSYLEYSGNATFFSLSGNENPLSGKGRLKICWSINAECESIFDRTPKCGKKISMETVITGTCIF